MPLLLPLLLACHDTSTPPGGDGPDVEEPDTDAPDTDAPPGDVDLYDPTVVHRIEIHLPEDSRAALATDPKTYVTGDITIDGEPYEAVGVRLKGGGTLRPLDGKPSFRIDLDRFAEQDHDGLTMLQFHNMVQDASQMHERLAWAAFEAAGLPFARVSYATIVIDEEAYGLYAVVEPYTGAWLDRTFPDASTGNLYEGGLMPNTIVRADFTAEGVELFELEEGGDVALADVQAITVAVAADPGDDWLTDLDEVLNVDVLVRQLAAELWLGQFDGYTWNANNYRVYVHPDDGRAWLLPQGLDLTLTEMAFDPQNTIGVLAQRCFADTACWEAYAAAVPQVSAAIDASDPDGLREETWALIEDELRADPRRGLEFATVELSQSGLEFWFSQRSQMCLGAIAEQP